MRVQTPLELSAVVRQARQKAGLTQAQLAERIGARRLWVVRFEQGKAEVELGLVMRALKELGISLAVVFNDHTDDHRGALSGQADAGPGIASIDLDALLAGEYEP